MTPCGAEARRHAPFFHRDKIFPMNIKSKIAATLALALTAAPLAAQTNGSNSPYSRYGLGLLSDGGNAFNKGMAGTAYGFRYGAQLNTKNPASLSAIDSLSLVFDLGVSLQRATFKQGGSTASANNTAIDYVTAGFRAAPGLGMAVGLAPYTTIGYSTTRSQTVQGSTDGTTQTETYSGDGGLREVFYALGWSPVKPLSVGLKAGYLWGEMEHTVKMAFSDNSVSSNRQKYSSYVRTYKVDFGVQYTQAIGKADWLTLGLSYGLGHDIAASSNYYNQKYVSSTLTAADTLRVSSAYSMPHTFGAGLTWNHRNSLYVGADYTLQKWGSAKMPELVDADGYGTLDYRTAKGSLTDMHRMSVGLEYVPNAEGVQWRKRIRYRAGFSYATPYFKVGGQDGPRDYTASFGVALPIMNMHNNRSVLNVSAQYERVQPKVSGMISENYFRLSIGLTFNERWFMKWKVE